MNKVPYRDPLIEREYLPAEKTFLINFGSKHLKPIRIELPEPPPLNYITGYGKMPNEQYFQRLQIPEKIVKLEKECYEFYRDKKGGTNYEIQERFWDILKKRSKELRDEITWMKHFIWYIHNGYWFFNDGQPTYISGWNFSYLHMHWMTLRKGEGYPEYDERQRRRFLFRKYIFETTETFADLDDKGRAVKVDGKYRMRDTGRRLFFGTIEPKGRREGLTNEFSHIICRIMTETYGADNLGTIISMDGDNAGTHFKKKLLPAFKKWPIWTQPIWKGGAMDIEFNLSKSIMDPNIKVLKSSINYTESGGDLANDGKKIMAAGFDEQGKGKRVGNVGNRWQINKETMSLEAGSDILGFCMHPSTVEKMEEGGQDYKEMCDMSDFYIRGQDGQTISGLAISYMPTSFCLRGYTDKFGKPILQRPTTRQIKLGFDKDIGSKTYIERRRNQLFDESDPKKMDEFRSFVRKYPEDYDDCWRGVAGYIGFPIEKMEERVIELENNPQWTRGRYEWINGVKLGKVEFIDDPMGHWYVSKILDPMKANLKSSMEYYSSWEDDYVSMTRPLYPNKGIIGVDPHEFNNSGESKNLKSKFSKLSDTGMVVFQKRDPQIDTDDQDKKSWKTRRAIACLEGRFNNNEEVAEEALKVAIYYGYLIHLERNKTEVWSWIIKWRYGGYLNHKAEILPNQSLQIDPSPGSYMTGKEKKTMFGLMKDQLNNHTQAETLLPLLKQAMAISSMEELTKYDMLAAYMSALIGAESIYSDVMQYQENEEIYELGITGKRV